MSYLEYHQKRFDYLLREAQRLLIDKKSPILEIGRGPFTDILKLHFENITTLGFELGSNPVANFAQSKEELPHIVFDLNDTQYQERWIELPKFSLIIFAEVVEHLYTAPELVISFLKTALAKNGFIILQTPNQVCIHNVIKMILGRNPGSRIAIDNRDPAHFREYTKSELIDIGNAVGLKTIKHEFTNYFGYHKISTKILDGLGSIIPHWSRGQTIIYQNN